MRTVLCLFALLGLSPLLLQAGEPMLESSAPAYIESSHGDVSHAASSCGSCNRGCNSCPDASLAQVPGRCGLNGPGCSASLWANYCNEKKPCWQPGMRHFTPATCRPVACGCGGLFGNCSHCRSHGAACSTGSCESGCSAPSSMLSTTDGSLTHQPTPATPEVDSQEATELKSDAEAPATPAEREMLQPVPPPVEPAATEAAPAEGDTAPVPPAPRTSRRTASARFPGRASGSSFPFGPSR